MKQALILLFIFMFTSATNVGSNSFQKVSWKDLRPELPAPIISTNEITLIDVENKIIITCKNKQTSEPLSNVPILIV